MRLVFCCTGVVCSWFGAPFGASGPKPTPAETYQVPYQLSATQHIVVRAKINGKGPFHFIVDTGAPTLYVSTDVCRRLHIEPDAAGWGKLPRFEIEGGIVLKNARCRVEDPFQLQGMNGLGLAGVTLHGILGYEVLARYRIEIDFTRDKMAWTALDFRPPIPQGISGKSAPPEIGFLAGAMKLAEAFLNKTKPTVAFRGFLGLEAREQDGGLVVQSVLAKSPAAQASVQVKDRICALNGRVVKTFDQLLRRAAQVRQGEIATLTIMRGTKELHLRIKTGEGL